MGRPSGEFSAITEIEVASNQLHEGVGAFKVL